MCLLKYGWMKNHETCFSLFPIFLFVLSKITKELTFYDYYFNTIIIVFRVLVSNRRFHASVHSILMRHLTENLASETMQQRKHRGPNSQCSGNASEIGTTWHSFVSHFWSSPSFAESFLCRACGGDTLWHVTDIGTRRDPFWHICRGLYGASC